jgi:hypothetical protein
MLAVDTSLRVTQLMTAQTWTNQLPRKHLLFVPGERIHQLVSRWVRHRRMKPVMLI